MLGFLIQLWSDISALHSSRLQLRAFLLQLQDIILVSKNLLLHDIQLA